MKILTKKGKSNSLKVEFSFVEIKYSIRLEYSAFCWLSKGFILISSYLEGSASTMESLLFFSHKNAELILYEYSNIDLSMYN